MADPKRNAPKHILLADDNEANRLIARTILERGGHRVTTVNNGSQALATLKAVSFDIVLLDIMMPVMDGVRALRRIRRECPQNGDMLIFALTAYSSAADRQRYRVAGFDGVLSKPLRPGDLDIAIAAYHNRDQPYEARPQMPIAPISKSLLDDELIEQLKQAGSRSRLTHVVERFWASVDGQCDQMKKSLPDALRGDSAFLSQFRRAVHGLKGACAAIGLARAAELARQLQNAPPAQIPELMRLLSETLKESQPALHEALLVPATGKLDLPMQMRR